MISIFHFLRLSLLFWLGAKGNPLRTELANNVVGKAVYFITNDDVNAVAALPIGNDGTLSQGTVTETGGAGSIALDADKQPATPDALVGQSALTIAGNVGTLPLALY